MCDDMSLVGGAKVWVLLSRRVAIDRSGDRMHARFGPRLWCDGDQVAEKRVSEMKYVCSCSFWRWPLLVDTTGTTKLKHRRDRYSAQ